MEEKYLAAEKLVKKYNQEQQLSQYDKLDEKEKA